MYMYAHTHKHVDNRTGSPSPHICKYMFIDPRFVFLHTLVHQRCYVWVGNISISMRMFIHSWGECWSYLIQTVWKDRWIDRYIHTYIHTYIHLYVYLCVYKYTHIIS